LLFFFSPTLVWCWFHVGLFAVHLIQWWYYIWWWYYWWWYYWWWYIGVDVMEWWWWWQ